MKHLIKKVLDRHKNGQFNMSSDSAREMLATEIEAVLIQDEQLRLITKELYKGEG
jgi:hypothetical protein|tara:strand:- start:329 stop:493 length:165 start_codon:yes stop_codon:yes gene_type:complete